MQHLHCFFFVSAPDVFVPCSLVLLVALLVGSSSSSSFGIVLVEASVKKKKEYATTYTTARVLAGAGAGVQND